MKHTDLKRRKEGIKSDEKHIQVEEMFALASWTFHLSWMLFMYCKLSGWWAEDVNSAAGRRFDLFVAFFYLWLSQFIPQQHSTTLSLFCKSIPLLIQILMLSHSHAHPDLVSDSPKQILSLSQHILSACSWTPVLLVIFLFCHAGIYSIRGQHALTIHALA